MNIHKKLNVLFSRSGTCQSERLLPYLMNNNFLISDQQLSHHLRFLYLYSDLITYYNMYNKPVNNNVWRFFLEQDDTVISSLILHTNIDVLKKIVNKGFLLIKKKRTEGSDEKYITNLLSSLEELIILINFWYKNLSELHPIKLKLYHTINQQINNYNTILYNSIKAYCKENYTEAFFKFCSFLESIVKKSDVWSIETSNTITEIREGIEEIALDTLNDLFDVIFNTITIIKQLAYENYDATLNSQDKKPHTALLITFLRLLEYADAHLNQIPQRHLEFYYREVLKFENNPSTSDHAYIHFKLKKNCPYYLLPTGITLVAKDTNDNEITFTTDRAITLNQGSIEKIHILHHYREKDRDNQINNDLFSMTATYDAEILSNHANTITPLFPIVQENYLKKEKIYQQMAILIASPILYLKEGKRVITLTYKFTPESFQKFRRSYQYSQRGKIKDNEENEKDHWHTLCSTLAKILKIQCTIQDAWLTIPSNNIQLKIIEDESSLRCSITLMPEIPSIVSFNSEVHSFPCKLEAPAIYIGIQDEAYINVLHSFIHLTLETINIQVAVSDYRDAILQNELGLIDTTQTFHPFGPMPKAHANFYIGSDEIFCKRVKDLKIKIKWEGIPTSIGGWKNYYKEYPVKLNNTDYNVDISYLKNTQWHPFSTKNRQQLPLFTVERDEQNNTELLHNETNLNDINLNLLGISQANQPLKTSLYTPHTLSGFLKLQLRSPEMVFGHAMYPSLMSKVLIQNAKNKNNQSIEPNPPYTPSIRSLTISYIAEESINLTKSTTDEEKKYHNSFLHLTPFGYKKIYPGTITDPIALIPYTDPQESYICLGIKNMNGSSLSLHIQVNEKSMNPYKEFLKPMWYYLSNNDWVRLNEENIISDGTNELSKSGILLLELPNNITQDNTCIDSGFLWIKIKFLGEVDALPIISGIYAQAVAVSRDLQNTPNTVSIVPANSITNIIGHAPEIESINQPFSSFGGNSVESDQAFYRRVSERLRHKNRAISVWDYERLILEKFPEIFRVKCINHMQKSTTNYTRPGHITIVVINDIKMKALEQYDLPYVSRQLLKEIKSFLKTVASPFVQLEVMNPVYEDVKVNATIKIKKGYEKGLFLNKLQQEIKRFLSPWLFNIAEDVTIGGSIPTSKVIDFINKKEYIEGIGNFSILKYTGAPPNLMFTKVTNYDSYLQANYPWSVMISAVEHKIIAVNSFDAEAALRHGGLGDMAIGEDFTIGPWEQEHIDQPENETIDHQEEKLIESLEDYYLITKKNITTNYGSS